MLAGMFTVSEAEAAAIRAVYEQRGELSAAVELRRRFPGILDNVLARECARIIASWKPLATEHEGRHAAGAAAVMGARLGFIPPRLSRSRNSLPVLKNGRAFSSTGTGSPVRGLRPMRALRRFTVKVPKPRSSTRSPRTSASVIRSNTVATISSTSAFSRCGLLAASSVMSSDLVNVGSVADDQRYTQHPLRAQAFASRFLFSLPMRRSACRFLSASVSNSTPAAPAAAEESSVRRLTSYVG